MNQLGDFVYQHRRPSYHHSNPNLLSAVDWAAIVVVAVARRSVVAIVVLARQ